MSQPQLTFDEELQRFRASTENKRGRYRARALLDPSGVGIMSEGG